MGKWYYATTSDEENGILYNPDTDYYAEMEQDFNLFIPYYMMEAAGLSEDSTPEQVVLGEEYMDLIRAGKEPPVKEWCKKWFNVIGNV